MKLTRRIISAALVLCLLMLPWASLAESDWQNILLMGCDLVEGIGLGHSDTMIVLSLNTKESRVKMTSIMRDTWVPLPGHADNKINCASYFEGPEYAVQVVNDNFGTDIEKYVAINIASLVNVIDLIGGIDIEITDEERYYINEHTIDTLEAVGSDMVVDKLTESGMVHLCGAQAVQHARNRTVGSDYERTVRQRAVILAIAQKVLSEYDVIGLTPIINEVLKNVTTNLKATEVISLALSGYTVDLSTIEQFRVPADGTFESGNYDGIWSIRPDFDQNRELLRAFIYDN